MKESLKITPTSLKSKNIFPDIYQAGFFDQNTEQLPEQQQPPPWIDLTKSSSAPVKPYYLTHPSHISGFPNQEYEFGRVVKNEEENSFCRETRDGNYKRA